MCSDLPEDPQQHHGQLHHHFKLEAFPPLSLIPLHFVVMQVLQPLGTVDVGIDTH